MRARHALRSVGRRGSPATQERARRAALGWGTATSALRIAPSVIVVGAQRSGTTTMFRLLEAHPDLVRPTLSKGTGYFDDDFDRSWSWYVGHFPLRRPGDTHLVTGRRSFECSGYYLFHPLAAGRIAAALPDVQVVALVRDPVARAFSAHRHEWARGFEPLGLEQALAAEQSRTVGEEARLSTEPGYRSFAHRHHAYVQRGEYARQIGRFRRALGADRVHVIDADRFFADPQGRFAALQRDLGLRSWTPPSVEAWNARPAPPPQGRLEARLREHFASHDEALAEILGELPSWRRGRVAS
ncbi:sulfotransferase [Nocardioides sp.]|uniref:sulfotransferase family protein n=1 Tax=Nocardioides sp. TaxID=35761 RepID=UPI002B26A523|nr:sulfotransferase [Nocardioides sp.]